MKIKLLSNLSLLAANVLVASSIVFQGQISTANSRSYSIPLSFGVYQVISYQYTKKSFTSDVVYEIWEKPNYGKKPIEESGGTRNIEVNNGGLSWNLAEISYQPSYSSTDTLHTINPGKKGILKFYWTGEEITGGTVNIKTYTPSVPFNVPEFDALGNISTPPPLLTYETDITIRSGIINYKGEWKYSEVDVPEPLTISGTGVALVFGFLLKRRAYLKSRT